MPPGPSGGGGAGRRLGNGAHARIAGTRGEALGALRRRRKGVNRDGLGYASVLVLDLTLVVPRHVETLKYGLDVFDV